MKTPLEVYLELLVSHSPALQARRDQCIQRGEMPVTKPIFVFAEIGEAIADNLTAFSQDSSIKTFAIIEDGMINENNLVKTAVATGLIEALVDRVESNPELWSKLQNLFGPASLSHALAWQKFGK